MTVRDAIVSAAPLLIAAALAFGPIGAWLANRRARNPAVWLILTAITGPVALALLLAGPPGQCASCGEPTVGFRATCVVCGEPTRHQHVRGGPRMVDVASHGVGPTRVADAEFVGATWGGPRSASDRRPVDPELVAVGPGRRKSRRQSATAEADASSGATANRPPRAEPADASADRLTAVGARRPSGPQETASQALGPFTRTPAAAPASQPAAATIPGTGTPFRAGLSILAIAVFVQGSENLLPGARYLLARTATHLVVVGPIEASSQHIELNLPLERVEAATVSDRLVVSGWESGRGRRWVLGFQSLNGLTATAVDEALRADAGRSRIFARS